MSKTHGLLRRYRGLFRPTDRAWNRWLKFGRPKRWGRERILRAWRRLDLVAIYMILMTVATVAAPFLVLQAVARRPFSYRAFVLSATALLGVGVALTFPLWTGTATGEVREVWRDRATILFLILGTWIAFAYQKRSSDLASVRDIYHQWLEVQSRAIQAVVLMGVPAVRLAQLRTWRESRPDLKDEICQRLLAGARDAHVAIQDSAHRMIEIGRRTTSMRLFALNDAALLASQVLNAKLAVLVDWQQEVVGIPSTMAMSDDELKEVLRDVQRACERVTQGLEIWLRT